MSELGRGWKAGIPAAIVMLIGLGCGGDKTAPSTTTLAPPTTVAPPPPTTAPAPPPSTVPSAAAEPGKPRAVPTVEVSQGGDLVSFSNVRWKDDTKRQVAADIRLLRGPVASLWFVFQDGDKQFASGVLPGSALGGQNGAVTATLPPLGTGAKGKEQVADIGTATRLVIHVVGLPKDAVAHGQPAWTAPLVTACEQGSATDCQTLAVAYRTGSSDQGAVKPDAELAARFSKLLVEMGESSCAMGGPENCFVLGRAYVTGEDVPANQGRGVALVQKACAAGVDAACSWMTANPAAFRAKPH